MAATLNNQLDEEAKHQRR